MGENRRSPRIKTSMAVAFSNSEDFLFGDIINICRNGFFIKTETILPVDTELKLSIRLPENLETLDIAGRVVWAKQISSASPAGMGIEFIGEAAEDRRKIENFVDEQRQEQNSSEE